MTPPLFIKENIGIDRINEPVTIGVPVPKGLLRDRSWGTITNHSGANVPIQITPLAHWPDRTVKWILVDSQISMQAGSEERHSLFLDRAPVSTPQPAIIIDEGNWRVDTGPATFFFNLFSDEPLLTCRPKQTGDAGTLDFVLNLSVDESKQCQLRIKKI